MNIDFLTLLILWLILSLIFWARPFFTHHWRGPLVWWVVLVRRLLGNSCGGLGRHSQSPALTADLVPVSTVVPHPSRPIVARGWGTRPKSHSSSSGAREWENRSNIYRPDRRLCDKAADRVQ